MAPKPIQLEADYLVIGAGASGMAFTDELIRHTTDISVIIVDRHSKPGGHWNEAYSFVTLHQPATFYGVNSKPLGKDGKDLATLAEINAYYESVMKELVETGRVKFFPQCEYQGDGEFHSMVAKDLEYNVKINRKTVDATYVSPTIPFTHKPSFTISDDVNFVPINRLSSLTSAFERYLIIGGGKTSIDAIIFLLDQSVDPNTITWIIPNDSWFFNRDMFFPETTWVEGNITLLNFIPNQTDYQQIFRNWEKNGLVFRIDQNKEPTKFTGATISPEEFQKVCLVKNIIRKRRISQIEEDRIAFCDGTEIETDENTLHVDCSANGSSKFIPKKIFNGPNISIQDVRAVQTAYSAAVIAAIEYSLPDDEKTKNEILTPIYRFQIPSEFLICILQDIFNEFGIATTLGPDWLRKSRLHPLHHVTTSDYERFSIYGKENGAVIVESLQKLISEIGNEKKKKTNCL